MKLSQIAELASAPLASLFVLLSLCAFVSRRKAAVGFNVPVLRLRQRHPGKWVDCGETRTIVISLNGNGELHINQDQTTWENLTPTITKIMEHNNEPSVYVLADANVPYAQFTRLMDKIYSSTEGLQVGLISGELSRGSITPCGLEWPRGKFVTEG
jgi:biopolymer transport protein ExbD